MIYLVFAILLPTACFLDYKAFVKRMEREMQKPPDYSGNRSNYDLLLERLCKRQKEVEIVVGIVLVLLAFLLFFVATGRLQVV